MQGIPWLKPLKEYMIASPWRWRAMWQYIPQFAESRLCLIFFTQCLTKRDSRLLYEDGAKVFVKDCINSALRSGGQKKKNLTAWPEKELTFMRCGGGSVRIIKEKEDALMYSAWWEWWIVWESLIQILVWFPTSYSCKWRMTSVYEYNLLSYTLKVWLMYNTLKY